MRHYRGFTLLEAIISAAIIAILMAIALPSLRTVLQHNNSYAIAYQFEEFLNFARHEALRRNETVIICPAANISLTQCISSSSFIAATSWNNGWIAFLDINKNGIIAAPSAILKVMPPLPSGNTIASKQINITFASTSFPITGAGNYIIKAAGCMGKTNGKILTLTSGANVRITNTSCP